MAKKIKYKDLRTDAEFDFEQKFDNMQKLLAHLEYVLLAMGKTYKALKEKTEEADKQE